MQTQLNTNPVKTATLVASLALLTTLVACSKPADDATAGQKLDSAVAKTEQAATDAKADAKVALSDAESSLKQAGQDAKVSASNTANKVGVAIDDAAITTAVNAALVKDKDLSALKIDVDTKAGVVTLYGPAPSASARERATTIAKAVTGVTSVNNQLVISAS